MKTTDTPGPIKATTSPARATPATDSEIVAMIRADLENLGYGSEDEDALCRTEVNGGDLVEVMEDWYYNVLRDLPPDAHTPYYIEQRDKLAAALRYYVQRYEGVDSEVAEAALKATGL